MKKILFASLMLLALAACGDGNNDQLTENQSKQVRDLVQKTVMENPKLVVDALEAYQAQSRREAAENTKKAMQSNAADLYNNPKSPVMGDANGDVTVVEFFDYNCGYCKSVFHPVRDAVLQDGKIRFVFKDFPILGENSVYAAKAALAAAKQNKYIEFHTALMDYKGAKDEAVLAQIASTLGLNFGQLKADMNDPSIQAIIDENYKLGHSLGINGTPAFVIGDKFYPGALDADSFKKLVAESRSAKNAAPAAPAPQPN